MTCEVSSLHASSIPILDLSYADDPLKKPLLLKQLHDALFNVGFLYIQNHGVAEDTIASLVSRLPRLFDQPDEAKAALSKLNSPHFLGYSGFAEESTLGKKDLREQFDLATDLPVIWRATVEPKTSNEKSSRDFTKKYWRLRGPNQWPREDLIPGFREAFTNYHDALQALSYRFVHLVEEAFGIPLGTFDDFFLPKSIQHSAENGKYMPPQHRIKLIKYPPSTGQSRVGQEEGLEVVNAKGDWVPVPPIEGTFVVNFGNAFEAATEGAVKATVHRVSFQF
ncbi:Clavaminate synthase-like protein [Mytilinidion resinicola]|uniref:Clavaminate synthase-like protein n=1 Tax=Mytilinidion resinicola TaxID=574789 RepID=A0A6A6XZC1_9PEZI|nr:Clavaminate synthase-like protein [Mytilinidion resinicola]KAF2801325.1 Clavaminate synthase-like protein [Mytilinidion resinicola]